jgi:hypothetical protein
VHAGFMTHWSEQTLTASRIDRCLCSRPGWALMNMKAGISTFGDPLTYSARGPGDHVPVRVDFSACPPGRSEDGPVPLRVCRSSLFEELVEQYAVYLDVPKLVGLARWVARKAVLRAAGRDCRDALMTGAGLEVAPLTARLTAVARAVWKKGVTTARALLCHPSLVARCLALVDGVPALLNLAAFA